MIQLLTSRWVSVYSDFSTLSSTSQTTSCTGSKPIMDLDSFIHYFNVSTQTTTQPQRQLCSNGLSLKSIMHIKLIRVKTPQLVKLVTKGP